MAPSASGGPSRWGSVQPKLMPRAMFIVRKIPRAAPPPQCSLSHPALSPVSPGCLLPLPTSLKESLSFSPLQPWPAWKLSPEDVVLGMWRHLSAQSCQVSESRSDGVPSASAPQQGMGRGEGRQAGPPCRIYHLPRGYSRTRTLQDHPSTASYSQGVSTSWSVTLLEITF